MTLLQLLSALITENVKAVVTDNGRPVCTIYAYGVEALDTQYKDSLVISWEIKDKQTIAIEIGSMPSV